MAARIISGNISGQTKDVSEDGFTPQDGIWKEEIETKTYSVSTSDANKIKAFEDICYICSANNINLYVVISPLFEIVENTSSTLLYMEQTCRDLNIPLLNFINDTSYFNNEYFLDAVHLNSQGADLFSKDLSHRILTINPDMF